MSELIRNYHPNAEIFYRDEYVGIIDEDIRRIFVDEYELDNALQAIKTAKSYLDEGLTPTVVLPIEDPFPEEEGLEATIIEICSDVGIDLLSTSDEVGYVVEPSFRKV